jgi:sensor domain CHASE-containing protein
MQLHTNVMDLFKRDFPTEFIKKNLQNQMLSNFNADFIFWQNDQLYALLMPDGS